MRVVHIIPTYNEKENIVLLLPELVKIARQDKTRKHLILVVDDNSPDRTGEVVKKFTLTHPEVFLLTGQKQGLGKAMIRGLTYALEKLKADVVIPNEADFAFDPKYILPALEKVDEGVDVVVGSRHVGGGQTEGWTTNRKINHWVANTFFATWVAGIREVSDHNGAFRAVRVKGVQDKLSLRNYPTGFGFFCYWLYRLTRVTEKFYELPVTYKFRVRGESKISFNPKYIMGYLRDVAEYIKLSFKIRQERYTIKR
ncbi:MAG: glycosyltransferase [bacterium]|nr:glycosyltransferase [bacterium]